MNINGMNGIRVPRWLITALAVGVAVLSAGYAVGEKVAANTARMNTIELRLCRIERALKIEPWPRCPSVHQ